MYMITGGLVLFLVLVRGMTVGLRPQRAVRPAHAKPAFERVHTAAARPASGPGRPEPAERAHSTR
jgi:hypothetical protein